MTARENEWLRVVYGEVTRKLEEQAQRRPDSTRTPDGVPPQERDDEAPDEVDGAR